MRKKTTGYISCVLLVVIFGGCDSGPDTTQSEPVAPNTTSNVAPVPEANSTPQPAADSGPAYKMIETAADGSRIVEYQVTLIVQEQRTRTTDAGVEEVYTVEVPVTETRQVQVPAGKDIDAYLAAQSAAPVPEAEPAPAPPALPQ